MRNGVCMIGKLTAAAMGFALMIGCEREPAGAPSAPAPDAAPAATAPATAPATTAAAPLSAVMNINGNPTIFPAARLRLEEEDGKVVALLYSDDPREALKDSYRGNSFYLRMNLDITDADELAHARWSYEVPSASKREESPYGIFLTGQSVQLRPFKADAAFKPDGDVIVVLIGQFEVIDADRHDDPQPTVVPVEAKLKARLDDLKARR